MSVVQQGAVPIPDYGLLIFKSVQFFNRFQSLTLKKDVLLTGRQSSVFICYHLEINPMKPGFVILIEFNGGEGDLDEPDHGQDQLECF